MVFKVTITTPLKGMVEGNHWDQWFSDGFGVRQPLVTIVFDGCAPFVGRWNGYVPSSKSNWHNKLTCDAVEQAVAAAEITLALL